MKRGIGTPSREVLIGCLWRFSHETGHLGAAAMRLSPDGRLENYDHPNERQWRIKAGALELLSETGLISVRFDEVLEAAEGRIRLRGVHRLDSSGTMLLLEQRRWGDDQAPFAAQTRLHMAHQIDHAGWTIGAHSYGQPLVYAHGPEKLHIGRYCSIGESVTIVLANHRPDFVTTYPFAQHRASWPGAPWQARDHAGKGDVVIGNDVWVGHGALITSGVRIGDGAVVAGQAVVTGDVPPYAIVGGNPARLLRYRFDEARIETLLSLRWWDWPDERVEFLTPRLLSNDIDAFIREAKRLRSRDPGGAS